MAIVKVKHKDCHVPKEGECLGCRVAKHQKTHCKCCGSIMKPGKRNFMIGGFSVQSEALFCPNCP